MGEGYEYVGVYVHVPVKKRGFPYRESRVVAKQTSYRFKKHTPRFKWFNLWYVKRFGMTGSNNR